MSNLPPSKASWPLDGHHARYEYMALCDAWYAGSYSRLTQAHGAQGASVTGGAPTTLNPQGGQVKTIATLRDKFWATSATMEVDTRRHLPLPEDIARHAARVLFSERLQIRVMGPTQPTDGPLGTDGKPTWLKGDPMPQTVAAQARLESTLAACKFESILLASAEVGSVLGASGLRIAFDKAGPINNRPVISRADADTMIPLYSWGQLVAVLFWQVVLLDTNGVIWRHIELHEGGWVYHALYKGAGDNLGDRQPLDALPKAFPAGVTLAGMVNADGGIQITKTGRPTATSIPNMLPDPQDRRNNAGRSDFTPAVMDLFDAADRTFTQMMDSIDDAKSRIIVAESMLEKKGAGKGVTFDMSQRVFTTVKVPPAEKEGGGLPLEKIQFDMHIAEYLSGIDAISRKAVEAAGYTARTDNGQTGEAVTATEVNSDDALTLGTRDVKIRQWQPELSNLLTTFLEVDVEQFAPKADDGTAVQAFPVEVTFSDAIQPTMLDLANVAKTLKDAGAASVYELVKLVHPDWNDAQVNVEVSRIVPPAIDPVSFGEAGAGLGVQDRLPTPAPTA